MVSTRVGNLRFWSGIRSGLTFDPPEEDPYIPRIGTAPPVTQYACLLLSTLMWLEFFKIYWESPCLGEALETATIVAVNLFLEGLSKMAPES